MSQVDRLLLAQGGHCFFCDRGLNASEARVARLPGAIGARSDALSVACCAITAARLAEFGPKDQLVALLYPDENGLCRAVQSTGLGDAPSRELRRTPAHFDAKNTAPTFRGSNLGPPRPGEWSCPICHLIGRDQDREGHMAYEHPEVVAGLSRIEQAMSPKVKRPRVFLGGSPGSGKRR
jgi:hypothetical protein